MNIKNIIKFIGIFFLYYLSDLVWMVPLSILDIIDLKELGSLSIEMQMLLMIASDLTVTIILGIIYKKYLIEKFKDFKNNFGKYLDIGIKYWLLGLLIMWIGNYLLMKFSPVKEAINENNVQMLISASPYLALILTTFLAPINEEIIFRKSVQDCFKNKWVFVIISAFIFGFLHVSDSKTFYDFLYIIPYGALGGAFAFILTKTNNIYTSILMHLIHNGILTLISIFL